MLIIYIYIYISHDYYTYALEPGPPLPLTALLLLEEALLFKNLRIIPADSRTLVALRIIISFLRCINHREGYQR